LAGHVLMEQLLHLRVATVPSANGPLFIFAHRDSLASKSQVYQNYLSMICTYENLLINCKLKLCYTTAGRTQSAAHQCLCKVLSCSA
jgi:hypothetical protein